MDIKIISCRGGTQSRKIIFLDIRAFFDYNAYTSFSAYQESGNDGDYWQGVAAFYAFQEAYGLLTEDTNKSTNRIFCNEVYGSLVLSPELSQAHISDIVYVMKILSENVMDENGYVRMLELRNTLQS